jgi:hypothetical protein
MKQNTQKLNKNQQNNKRLAFIQTKHHQLQNNSVKRWFIFDILKSSHHTVIKILAIIINYQTIIPYGFGHKIYVKAWRFQCGKNEKNHNLKKKNKKMLYYKSFNASHS